LVNSSGNLKNIFASNVFQLYICRNEKLNQYFLVVAQYSSGVSDAMIKLS